MLPLTIRQAKGGTLALWKSVFDPYVTPLPSLTSSFLTLLFNPPDATPSIHITVYLPTSGREDDFMNETVKLYDHLHDMTSKYPEHCIFLRGDANVNQKNTTRLRVLNSLCSKFNLQRKELKHNTYHHFTGEGQSDSELDVLIFTPPATETLLKIFCRLDDPNPTSHHDALLSSFTTPPKLDTFRPENLPRAPRVSNQRVKVHWDDSGIESYSKYVGLSLEQLRRRWSDSSSPSSMDVLFHATNKILDTYAKHTNYHIELSAPRQINKRKKLKILTRSEAYLRRSHNMLKSVSKLSSLFLSMAHKEKKCQHSRTSWG